MPRPQTSTSLALRQIASPAADAPANTTLLYAKSDGLLYRKVGATEFPVDTGGTVYTPDPVVEFTSNSTSAMPDATWTVLAGWTGGRGGYISGFTSGVATFTLAGMYLMDATLSVSSSVSFTARFMMGFAKNGSEVRRHDYGNQMKGPVTMHLSTIVPMNVGDTANVQAFQAMSTAQTSSFDSTINHQWHIWRISGDTAFA